MKISLPLRAFGMAFLSLLVLLASDAKAVVLVDFDGDDYTSSNFANMNGYTSGTSTVAYSDSTYRYPTANYDDTQTSAKFYGGATSTGVDGITTYRVRNSDPDGLQIGSSGTGSSVSMFTFWDQDDFLNLSTGNVSLTSTTNISLTIEAGQSGRSADARLVIRQSGSYFVSSILVSTAGTTPDSVSLDDPTSLSWFNYDPFTDVSVIGSSASLPNLDGLTGIGIQAMGTAIPTENGSSVEATSITLNGAVPEPSTGVLLGLGSGWLLLRRRRVHAA